MWSEWALVRVASLEITPILLLRVLTSRYSRHNSVCLPVISIASTPYTSRPRQSGLQFSQSENSLGPKGLKRGRWLTGDIFIILSRRHRKLRKVRLYRIQMLHTYLEKNSMIAELLKTDRAVSSKITKHFAASYADYTFNMRSVLLSSQDISNTFIIK